MIPQPDERGMRMAVTLYRVSAFPSDGNGGNEAGVVVDAEHLTEAMMKRIAARVNYSETAFLSKSDRADFKLRYFTPTTEVPVCGHATIAAFNMMRNLGLVEPGRVTLETAAGVLDIIVEEDAVQMQLFVPTWVAPVEKASLADALGLPDDVFSETPAEVLDSGIKEIFVGFKHLADVHRFAVETSRIEALCEAYEAHGLYLYTLETLTAAQAHGRNFAPCLGIAEESATGTASAALATHLHRHHDAKRTHYRFEQGYAMFKPSRIDVTLTLEEGGIRDIHIGGSMRFIDKIVGFNAKD